jgi:hypothetical protein
VTLVTAATWLAGALLGLVLASWLLGFRYIPHNKVGVVEKLWAGKGSLKEGRILAVDGEAGFQADLLRGGAHAFFFPWQYRIHRESLVSIPEGKIGYVYSRDGDPLTPVQTLGRVIACHNFQDARRFLAGGGQRGRQRAILREGVYAINLALFVVVAEDRVYQGPVRERNHQLYTGWQAQLHDIGGFDPIVVGSGAPLRHDEAEPTDDPAGASARDNIGVVTIHDGPPIESGEVIAPEVHAPAGAPDHDCFQDPEAVLALGGLFTALAVGSGAVLHQGRRDSLLLDGQVARQWQRQRIQTLQPQSRDRSQHRTGRRDLKRRDQGVGCDVRRVMIDQSLADEQMLGWAASGAAHHLRRVVQRI